ncbi:carboxymuconolactone decarboxylase family protein [Actinomadura barringtoniae]|uniref:Carboxymuconolactone decarboxylase family protein n=1 Tax=Actinomadura barringtoniae TaxID=1427535 RepID=A0A939T4Z5_9ACTN|nr:carboxymuconolactone decarboxylase family protein [Actinomadura barringtoniae]MBO2446482.1 carboxymuconolactone decarboxylase family protein [Actinomadura barringtoniae]
MEARMKNPAYVLPDALKGIQNIFKGINQGGISQELQELVGLRASQINGCSACTLAHVQSLRKAGSSEERIATVAAWREAPFFTEAEQAALELTEHVTRMADRSGKAVSDELWDRVADHYDEKELSAIILTITVTNMFNRLNATIEEPAGQTWG